MGFASPPNSLTPRLLPREVAPKVAILAKPRKNWASLSKSLKGRNASCRSRLRGFTGRTRSFNSRSRALNRSRKPATNKPRSRNCLRRTYRHWNLAVNFLRCRTRTSGKKKTSSNSRSNSSNKLRRPSTKCNSSCWAQAQRIKASTIECFHSTRTST